jgi:hypothetical protein
MATKEYEASSIENKAIKAIEINKNRYVIFITFMLKH